MKEFVGQRLQAFKARHSMGVVSDTRFIRCFWPRLDEPTELFAPGSSGIEVAGPPTPRNVIFPEGTAFLDQIPKDGGASIPTRETFVLRHFEDDLEYKAELSKEEALAISSGRVDRAALVSARKMVAKGPDGAKHVRGDR